MIESGDPGLEGAIDDVYRAPLDGFIAARNSLAAALRKAGRRSDADRVKALAKPAATAWALNQVWWQDRSLLEALLAAGAAERAAHAEFAAGRQADIRGASTHRERAVTAVVDAAVRTLGKSGNAEARFRIAGTAEALASSGVPEDVRPGRLTRDLQSSGLESIGGWAAAAAAAPATPARPVLVASRPVAPPPATARRGNRDAVREARAARAHAIRAERLSEARKRIASLASSLEEADREHEATRDALTVAQAAHERGLAEVEDLERRLDEARQAASGARKALNDATRAASEAELQRGRVARALARARDEAQSVEADAEAD